MYAIRSYYVSGNILLMPNLRQAITINLSIRSGQLWKTTRSVLMQTRITSYNVCYTKLLRCHQCLASNMEWFEVSGRGKLVTYSKLEYAPIGFQDDVPYSIALVDYGDYKVFGRISSDLPEEEIKPGMEMQTVVNTLPNGQLV